MIKVNKDYNDIPHGLTTSKAKSMVKALLREKNDHQFSHSYYSHASVKEKLRNDIYHAKCAYCECSIEAGASLQIDHFRPKKFVKGEDHTGYYWLAYQWSNLLLCCPICNRSKSNLFPILGKQVKYPQKDKAQWQANSKSFLAEEPLLLNPETDNPEKHFEFLRNGTITSKTKQGLITIEVCQLNRKGLAGNRRKAIDRFKKDIGKQVEIIYDKQQTGKLNSKEKFLDSLELGFKTLFENLMNTKKPENEYSRLGWHLINKFDEFFVESLHSEEQKQIVKFAFSRFKSS